MQNTYSVNNLRQYAYEDLQQKHGMLSFLYNRICTFYLINPLILPPLKGLNGRGNLWIILILLTLGALYKDLRKYFPI